MWRTYGMLAVLLLAARPAEAETVIVVTREDCRHILAHVPEPDVRYSPGVDVHGRPVAPADLPDAYAPRIPDEIGIALTIPLAAVLGEATPGRLGDSDIEVGRIAVERETGRVSYDGRPLADPARHAVAAECARRQRAARERR